MVIRRDGRVMDPHDLRRDYARSSFIRTRMIILRPSEQSIAHVREGSPIRDEVDILVVFLGEP
jgi:hypothetical protein